MGSMAEDKYATKKNPFFISIELIKVHKVHIKIFKIFENWL